MKYPFLALGTISRYIHLMQAWGVSEVARSKRGFLTAYREAKGSPNRLSPEWHVKREGFIARHMAQVIGSDEDFFQADGLPTRRHLALIAWAYSPRPRKL